MVRAAGRDAGDLAAMAGALRKTGWMILAHVADWPRMFTHRDDPRRESMWLFWQNANE
jgi:hypothetical protein